MLFAVAELLVNGVLSARGNWCWFAILVSFYLCRYSVSVGFPTTTNWWFIVRSNAFVEMHCVCSRIIVSSRHFNIITN